MPIHRGFMRPRRYTPSTSSPQQPDSFLLPKAGQPEDIPLPNTPEIPLPETTDTLQRSSQNYITLFNMRIHLEDIILLGVIFVLLQEGIEDELLLIILLFILFT